MIFISKDQIKGLAKEFEGQFECLGENTEKCITFFVPINKKATKTDKNNNEKSKKIPYKQKFIDSFRFMSASLSSLVNNLFDGLHSDKCTDCRSCIDYMPAKDNRLIFKCLNCNKISNTDFTKEVINRF